MESGAETAPAMCPARYSDSGRTSSSTTSPRASLASSSGAETCSTPSRAPRYSSASTFTSATCHAATSRTAAQSSSTRSLARRYTTRWPSRRERARPALASSRRWCDVAARLCPTSFASSSTERSPCESTSTISARRPLPSAAATEANASNKAVFATRSLISSNYLLRLRKSMPPHRPDSLGLADFLALLLLLLVLADVAIEVERIDELLVYFQHVADRELPKGSRIELVLRQLHDGMAQHEARLGEPVVLARFYLGNRGNAPKPVL